MSGGHWNYLHYKLEEMGENVADLYRFIAVVENELDWGISGDSCEACAKNRVGEAMCRFFDGDTDAAIALMRYRESFMCDTCKGLRG